MSERIRQFELSAYTDGTGQRCGQLSVVTESGKVLPRGVSRYTSQKDSAVVLARIKNVPFLEVDRDLMEKAQKQRRNEIKSS